MLTANDGGRDGRLTKYRQGAGRPDLYKFLKDKLKKRQRKVSYLQEYFDNNHFQFKYCPYGDTLDKEFINDGREGGQTVAHLHLHFLGGRSMGWPPG